MPAALDLQTTTAVKTREAAPTQPTARTRTEPDLLAWETLEYHLPPKSLLWYGVFGVALAALLFTAFLMRSFLTGVVFVLLGLLVLLYSERPPRALRVRLTPNALFLNDRRYLYADLDAFHIVESPTGMLALIRSKRLVMPLLHVPLDDTDPERVRATLARSLTEDPDLREPLPDILAHYLGF